MAVIVNALDHNHPGLSKEFAQPMTISWKPNSMPLVGRLWPTVNDQTEKNSSKMGSRHGSAKPWVPLTRVSSSPHTWFDPQPFCVLLLPLVQSFLPDVACHSIHVPSPRSMRRGGGVESQRIRSGVCHVCKETGSRVTTNVRIKILGLLLVPWISNTRSALPNWRKRANYGRQSSGSHKRQN